VESTKLARYQLEAQIGNINKEDRMKVKKEEVSNWTPEPHQKHIDALVEYLQENDCITSLWEMHEAEQENGDEHSVNVSGLIISLAKSLQEK
jgi:hypothetical protein